MSALALVALALAPAGQAASDADARPILDRYYQCLVDGVLDFEASRERADIVARAVVHKCRPLFPEASRALRTDKADAARSVGLDPNDAARFDAQFRDYSLDHALTHIVRMRAREHE